MQLRIARWTGCSRVTVLVIWFLWAATGLLILCVGEGLEVVTALYIMTQILTTIGYGDVVVQTKDSSKALLSVYVLITTLMMTTLLTAMMSGAYDKMKESISDRVCEDQDAEAKDSVSAQASILAKARRSFLQSLAVSAVMIILGTIVYGAAEQCTCSYAESQVEGCVPESCAETGGYAKTYLDAFYMSCISLSSVGFGDVSPKSFGGRIFALFWMVFGCVALAVLQITLSWYVFQLKVARDASLRDENELNELFDAIDKDGSEQLSRFEFLTFRLAEMGLVSIQDIDIIGREFDFLDKDHSGHLCKGEVLGLFLKFQSRRASCASMPVTPSEKRESLRGRPVRATFDVAAFDGGPVSRLGSAGAARKPPNMQRLIEGQRSPAPKWSNGSVRPWEPTVEVSRQSSSDEPCWPPSPTCPPPQPVTLPLPSMVKPQSPLPTTVQPPGQLPLPMPASADAAATFAESVPASAASAAASYYTRAIVQQLLTGMDDSTQQLSVHPQNFAATLGQSPQPQAVEQPPVAGFQCSWWWSDSWSAWIFSPGRYEGGRFAYDRGTGAYIWYPWPPSLRSSF